MIKLTKEEYLRLNQTVHRSQIMHDGRELPAGTATLPFIRGKHPSHEQGIEGGKGLWGLGDVTLSREWDLLREGWGERGMPTL